MRPICLMTFWLCVSLCVGCGPTAKPTRIPPKATASKTTPATSPSTTTPSVISSVTSPSFREGRSLSDGEGAVANDIDSTTLSNTPASDLTKEATATTTPPVQTTPAGSTSSTLAKSTSGKEQSFTAEPDQASRPIPAERVLLLTDAGPLLIDLHITITGTAYEENFQQIVGNIMSLADDDSDGIVTWDQLMAHPRFSQGQFGNPASTTYQAAQDMIRQYDTTKTVASTPTNWFATSPPAHHLDRSHSTHPTTVARSTETHRPFVVGSTRTTTLRSTARRSASATERLRLRDANDDEVLLVSDFTESNAGQTNMMARRRPGDTQYLPKVGWQLDDNQLWSDIQVAWNDYFALGQSVQEGDLGITSPLFEKLDLDGNGSLDSIEMEMLLEVESDLSVNVELGTGSAENTATVELAALRLPQDSIYSIIQQPNRITIKLAKTTIDLFAKDLIGYDAYDQQAMGFLRQGDADENSYLDEEEFERVAQLFNGAPFEVADLNSDGKVVQDEIVTALEQRNIITRNQVSVRADDQDDALFPTIDLNSDGRIDSREMAEASATLLTLDNNGDGEVALHELQGSMMIGVVRGGNRGTIMQGDTTFQVPQAVRKPSDAAPRWFTAMDRNRDQGISWREFLGTRAQFDEMDADQDGFLMLDEAVSE